MNAGRPVETRLRWWWVLGAALALFAAIIAGVMIGVAEISPVDVVRSILDRVPFVDIDTEMTVRDEAIIWKIRMPRVILGVTVGSMLSAAGGGVPRCFQESLS